MYKDSPQPEIRENNSNSTPQIVHQEFLDDDQSGWLVQWRQRRIWQITAPRLKECKKRKDSYSVKFEPIMYKSPYKYHIHMTSMNMKTTEPVIVQLALNFENGENITGTDNSPLSNGQREVKIQKFEKTTNSNTNELEVTVGPFQFNVCSFRQDGRKFRIVLHLFSSMMNMPTLICSVVSPPFIIRAKKPIKNPGLRKKKRKREKAEANLTNKKRKLKNKNSINIQVSQPLSIPNDLPKVPINSINRNENSLSLTDHIKQQSRRLLLSQNITFNPPPTFSPVGLLNLSPPSMLQTSIGNPSNSNNSNNVNNGKNNNLTYGNNLTFSRDSHNDNPTDMKNERLSTRPSLNLTSSSSSSSSSMNNIPYSNSSQIDMFDFLMSEQEEPCEKEKDISSKMVAEYVNMNSEKRISLLSRLLEMSYPSELEYIRAIFFSDGLKELDILEDKNPQVFSDMDKLIDDNYSIGGSDM